MTVAKLIEEWLYEAGEDALSKRVAKKLEGNEFAGKEVGFDLPREPVQYITKWGHEHTFVILHADSF